MGDGNLGVAAASAPLLHSSPFEVCSRRVSGGTRLECRFGGLIGLRGGHFLLVTTLRLRHTHVAPLCRAPQTRCYQACYQRKQNTVDMTHKSVHASRTRIVKELLKRKKKGKLEFIHELSLVSIVKQ
ncbi:hypothetical protein BS50DRAFT_176313 [Corynespora cassiicola Philippines]|uniref:Uncharacterized protein n=1 Tax=Corynespora cassiicola Philippines TaxID=1448308 RepID=A0A2T2P5Q1_CORCC|nr:hypothetical protein BS50DRAFT_176313 [Corynespora cassiicola Philippines]